MKVGDKVVLIDTHGVFVPVGSKGMIVRSDFIISDLDYVEVKFAPTRYQICHIEQLKKESD